MTRKFTRDQEKATKTAVELHEKVLRGELEHERLALEVVHGSTFLFFEYWERVPPQYQYFAGEYTGRWIMPEILASQPSIGNGITRQEAKQFLEFVAQLENSKPDGKPCGAID